ncbi:tetratricopeptide repeat protein [Lentzea atacamensis]|uniref:Tetratricopeptide repeat protein n=1 Tax=Lentzea atacamensis TaxID=531938 RepID=A0ABX9EJ01_9PSEU|nr:tetratricopeptide repeat protein [Lentzea atacamensis]RAS69926.1 tetratricopeptide repeat protein [Lentzea atacamensis]
MTVVGFLAARVGDLTTAWDHCQAALTLNRQLHNPDGEAGTLDSLGFIAHRSGDHHQALDLYQQALTRTAATATATRSRTSSTTSAIPTPPSDSTTTPARSGRRPWSCTATRAATTTPPAYNGNSTASPRHRAGEAGTRREPRARFTATTSRRGNRLVSAGFQPVTLLSLRG